MKCIRCSRDSKYSERGNRTCPGCGGQFAFEPQAQDPVTDALFQKAIDSISSQGQVRWGIENLYYEVCRRKQRSRPHVSVGIALLLLAGMLAGVALAFPKAVPLWFIVVFAGIGGLVTLSKSRGAYVPLTGQEFRPLWERWCHVHGTPTGAIARREAPASTTQAEPDLGDYSFDRAVICDRARTVDLLLANNFHFENNCAILSIDGYPKGPFATVRAMLRRNPRLQVFVLHDATPVGCRLARRLAKDREWFPEPVRIIDVGLRPGHAKQFRGVWDVATNPVEKGEGLTQSEVEWLSESRLELAAVRPQQVIRWLFRALNSQKEPQPSDTEAAVNSGGDGLVFFYLGDDSQVLVNDTQAVEADFDSFG